jgi:hypothetical protein
VAAEGVRSPAGRVAVSEESPFAGRIVSVWLRDPAQGGVLENVRIQQLGARTFLVGQIADDGKSPDPRAGAIFWFPVDDVLMLTVYADVQAARTANAAQGKQPAETGQRPSRWPWRN